MCIKFNFEMYLQRNIPYVINADGVMLIKHGNFVKNMIKRVVISKAAGCFASGNLAKNYFMKYGAKEKNIYLHTFQPYIRIQSEIFLRFKN